MHGFFTLLYDGQLNACGHVALVLSDPALKSHSTCRNGLEELGQAVLLQLITVRRVQTKTGNGKFGLPADHFPIALVGVGLEMVDLLFLVLFFITLVVISVVDLVVGVALIELQSAMSQTQQKNSLSKSVHYLLMIIGICHSLEFIRALKIFLQTVVIVDVV